MRIFRYLAPTAAACAAAVVLAACGSGGDSGGQREVASLDTSSSSARSTSSGTSSTEQDSKRPRYTLDMTSEEWSALLFAWQGCLIDHGVPPARPKIEGYDNSVKKGADKEDFPKAYETCYSMKPIPPPELDPATNPHYMDSYSAMIDCMHEKGFMVKALPNGGGYNYPPGGTALGQEKQEEIHNTCRREAFSDDLK